MVLEVLKVVLIQELILRYLIQWVDQVVVEEMETLVVTSLVVWVVLMVMMVDMDNWRQLAQHIKAVAAAVPVAQVTLVQLVV